MRRTVMTAAALGLAAALLPAVAGAHPEELGSLPWSDLPVDAEALHTHDGDAYAGMTLVGNVGAGEVRQGTDLAFWGDLAIVGNYALPGGFRVVDIAEPTAPVQVGQFVCPGPQADVSVWEDLVFVSVDSPQRGSACGSTEGEPWEGIRIASIADPARPAQIAAVATPCGSHTHTLVPQPDHRDEAGDPAPRVLVYVSSYPLGAPTATCSVASHRQISVIEVPLAAPEHSRILSEPDVSPAIGCHDITVLPGKNLAAAACISESQIWDIGDPVNPRVLAHIANPAMEIHHSSAFSWDGGTLVLGDEMGGAAAAAGCFAGGHAPTGSLWFYDVTDPRQPKPVSYYTIPQQEDSVFCTAHNFNVVPTRGGEDVLVTAWYNGGTHVLDFTDPADVTPIAFAQPGDAAAWSSYWYNGHVYASHFDEGYVPEIPHSRGLDVYAADKGLVPKAYALPWLNPQTQIPPPAMAAQDRRTARG